METFGDIIKKRIESKEQHIENKNIHSRLHFVVDEMTTYFGEKKKFGVYLGLVKRVGIQNAYDIYSRFKENGDRRAALFFWHLKQRYAIIKKQREEAEKQKKPQC
jgi:hypothetical protein